MRVYVLNLSSNLLSLMLLGQLLTGQLLAGQILTGQLLTKEMKKQTVAHPYVNSNLILNATADPYEFNLKTQQMSFIQRKSIWHCSRIKNYCYDLEM